MKAIACTQYGSTDFLKLIEMEKPEPKKNEVLIKIHATSVTTSDVLIRQMDLPPVPKFLVQLAFGFGKPRNPVLGMVLSGVVEKVGDRVDLFSVGDEVFAYGSMSATKRRFGAYAEYMCLPQDWNLALKPAGLSFEEAAAIPYGGLLAMHVLKKATIQPGDDVLIYGASGSIGTMAIQLAKNAGANVTAVCSESNRKLVKSLGADSVIDYTESGAEDRLGRYNYVIDAVGKQKTSVLKERSKKALKEQGKYISIDSGVPATPKEHFLALRQLADEGKIVPVIDKVYNLEQMAEAHKYVETGHKKGNVVVKIV